jgi:hypothetical protein
MTTTTFETWEQLIRDALNDRGGDLTTLGRGQWDLDDAGHAVEVRLRDEWLTCRAPMPGALVEEDVVGYLWANPHLPGACRIALDPRQPVVCLREDVLVIEGIDVSRACVETIAHLTSARAALAKKSRARSARRRKPRQTRASAASFNDSLEDVCHEAGWDYAERDGGRGVVTLELPHGTVPAFLDAHSERDYRVSAPLACYQALSDAGGRAVSVLMLTANAIVRFVRAGIEQSVEGLSAFFERRFSERPSPACLDAALSALSVAGRLCQRELRALENDQLAHLYLDARGMSPAPAGSLSV